MEVHSWLLVHLLGHTIITLIVWFLKLNFSEYKRNMFLL